MQKKQYVTVIPDLEYYRKIFNCCYACPVHTKAGNYVTAIADGEYEKAYNIAHDPNPFVYVCGRVCGHPCETACRRGEIDKPVSIRALKRFATEKHSRSHKISTRKSAPLDNAKKVAVIGAGPAGLSAAHDLAEMEYSVTIFEKTSAVGGMLYLGLPKYRLPRYIIREEIDAILSLGIEVRVNTAIGKDFSITDLRGQGYEAIFLSIGADKGRGLNIEGEDMDGVLNGIDFLLNVNLGYKVDLGSRAIIIGGGNVAIDVARSVVREIADIDNMPPDEMKETLHTVKSVFHRLEQVDRRKKPRKDELRVALDVARSAMRMGEKDIDVKMICLESREEMPAHEWEIEEAGREGIAILPSLGPRRIHGKDGKVTGLEVIEIKSVFDENGRFNPTYVEGTNKIIPTDSIILAVGQASDLSFIRPEDNIEITKRGTIAADPATCSTTSPGIYAGGDAAFGPRLIIDAVADGKRAAAAIDQYLNKEEKAKQVSGYMKKVVPFDMPYRYDSIPRHDPPALPVDRRIGLAEVELCYSDKDAKIEGTRCLKCDINTIFDSSKCILCGGCMDICPQYCLKMVRLDQIYGEDDNLSILLQKMLGEEQTKEGSAIIKDENRCIRCALCAQRCPVGAITMERILI